MDAMASGDLDSGQTIAETLAVCAASPGKDAVSSFFGKSFVGISFFAGSE